MQTKPDFFVACSCVVFFSRQNGACVPPENEKLLFGAFQHIKTYLGAFKYNVSRFSQIYSKVVFYRRVSSTDGCLQATITP